MLRVGLARLSPGTIELATTVKGDGWTLTLPAGWRVVRLGKRLEVRPPR